MVWKTSEGGVHAAREGQQRCILHVHVHCRHAHSSTAYCMCMCMHTACHSVTSGPSAAAPSSATTEHPPSPSLPPSPSPSPSPPPSSPLSSSLPPSPSHSDSHRTRASKMGSVGGHTQLPSATSHLVRADVRARVRVRVEVRGRVRGRVRASVRARVRPRTCAHRRASCRMRWWLTVPSGCVPSRSRARHGTATSTQYAPDRG